jgi:hypothetical protein
MHGPFTQTRSRFKGEHIDFELFDHPDAAGGTSKRWSLTLDGRLVAKKPFTTTADLKRDLEAILVEHRQEQAQDPDVLRLKGTFLLHRPVDNSQLLGSQSWELYLTRHDGKEVRVAAGDGHDLARIAEALLEAQDTIKETVERVRQPEQEAERGRGPTPRPEEVYEMRP